MKPLVVFTYTPAAQPTLALITPHARVVIANNRRSLLHHLKTADALCTLLTDTVDQDLLEKAPRLRVITNMAVGTNNIDLKACRARGITVTNTPDVLTRATAELTLTLLLAVARRIGEGMTLCKSGRFKGWKPDMLCGLDLRGRHAVILGKGRIGRETAKLFKAIGLSVSFITRESRASESRAELKRAQVLSIHAPLTPLTHHWLDARRLALLPRDAIVINTARGPIIDEQALTRALRDHKIFGAGLDVFEHEPLIPAALKRLSNAVLLPHIGSATHHTRSEMGRLVARGVISGLKSKKLGYF